MRFMYLVKCDRYINGNRYCFYYGIYTSYVDAENWLLKESESPYCVNKEYIICRIDDVVKCEYDDGIIDLYKIEQVPVLDD